MATPHQPIELAGPVQARRRATVRSAAVFAVAFATGLSTSAQAAVEDYPARNIAGWTVAASSDQKGCFLTQEYDRAGGTTLLLGLDIDGTNHLSVLNANWSIKPQDQLKLDFRLSNGGYAKHFAVGMASDGKRGFVTNFETKFPAYFATSKFLHIYRGNVPVEQLSLDGSGAAIKELRNCVAVRRAKYAAGASGSGRSDRIPKDPFTSDSDGRSKKSQTRRPVVRAEASDLPTTRDAGASGIY